MHMSSNIAAAILAFCASRVGSVPVAEVAIRQAASSSLDAAATDLVTGAVTSSVVGGPSSIATATGELSDIISETGLAIPTGDGAIPTATSGNFPGNTGAPGPDVISNDDDGPFDGFEDGDDDGDDGDDGPRGNSECRRPRRNRPDNDGMAGDRVGTGLPRNIESRGNGECGRPRRNRPINDGAIGNNGVSAGLPRGGISTANVPTGAVTGAATAAPPAITGGIGNGIETGSVSDAIFVPSGSLEASVPTPTGLEGAVLTGVDDTASILPVTTSVATEQATETANLAVRQILQGDGAMGPPDGQFDGQIPPEVASRIPASILEQISAGNFPTAIPEDVRSRFANGERPTGRPGGPGSPFRGNIGSAGNSDVTGTVSAQLPEQTQAATA